MCTLKKTKHKKTNNSNNTTDTYIPKIPNLNKLKTSPTHYQSNSCTTADNNNTVAHISPTTWTPPTSSAYTVNDYTTTADNNTSKFFNDTSSELFDNTTKINQTQYNTDTNTKNVFTFAAITSNDKPPSREQGLVLNTIKHNTR